MERLFNLLRGTIPGLELRTNEPMSKHTSFRIGGPCLAMALPKSENELAILRATLWDAGIDPLIVGNGTNLLVSDDKLTRFVIKLGEGFSKIEKAGKTSLKAQSGASLARVAATARDKGLAGLEFAHGIPGSIGGAVVMNAGAYGGEMRDVVRSVRTLDKHGDVRELPAAECDFSYRHSVFSDSELIITGCTVELAPDSPEQITQRMRELSERRRASQPLDKPSAGSTFKRPVEGYAASLIDKAGLKGFRIGGAAVSDKHSGFVVNLGGASFCDVIAVMEHVQKTVLEKYGIELEPEVRIIGG